MPAPPARKVRDHGAGDLLGEGADALRDHAVVAGHHQHGFAVATRV